MVFDEKCSLTGSLTRGGAERHGTPRASFLRDGLTFPRATGILEKQVHSRLFRVERTEYGMRSPTAIRSRVEVRNGSALPERLRERPAEENLLPGSRRR